MQDSPRKESAERSAPASEASNDPLRADTPDFGAIDTATANAVSVDSTSLKEEEQLFKKVIRSEMQRLVIYALRAGAAILFVMLFVRFWHLASPTSWRWLSDVEIQAIDKMLFSSAFGGFVLTYLKDTMTPTK